MNVNDVVVLKSDLSEQKLERGMKGVVVAVLEQPEKAYEVEFCNQCGETITQIALKREQLEKI